MEHFFFLKGCFRVQKKFMQLSLKPKNPSLRENTRKERSET